MVKCPNFGWVNRILHWNHWARMWLILRRDYHSSRNGSIVVTLWSSGFQGSFSLKVSLRVCSKTMPESTRSPSMRLSSISSSWMTSLILNLKTAPTYTVYSFKAVNGMQTENYWTNQIRKCYLLNARTFGWDPLMLVKCQTTKIISAQCTKHQQEEVCSAQQAIRRTSSCISDCQLSLKKGIGLSVVSHCWPNLTIEW